MQKDGLEFAAREVVYHANEYAAEFSLNIEAAYPVAAGLQSWRRTLRLDRAQNQVELRDKYTLRKDAAQIMWTFMSPWSIKQIKPGEVGFSGKTFPSGPVSIYYDAQKLTPTIEEISLEDGRLRSAWGERLYRLLFKVQNPPREGDWLFRVAQK
jgi:hypothetical protein